MRARLHCMAAGPPITAIRRCPSWSRWRAAENPPAQFVAPTVATLGSSTSAHSIAVQAGDKTHVFHTEFTAGRQGSLVLSDEHASSHHALFQPAHGYWFVQDLGSTNGTWLNGRRMFAAQRLKKGDKIKIGRTIVVVVSTT